MRQVIQLARLCNWTVYHTRDSRGSAAGYPDLTCVRPATGSLIFAELKAAGGRTTAAQRAWLEALRAAGQRAFLWTPKDWPQVEEVLKGG